MNLKTLLAIAAISIAISPAKAEDKTPEQLREEKATIFNHNGLEQHKYTRYVITGKEMRVGAFTWTEGDCSSMGDSVVRVTKQPEHGTVKTAPGSFYPAYAKEHIRYKCNQHKVQGTLVNYKSEDKYIGPDAVELLVIFPQGSAWEVSIDLNVK
jgi:hypothetical protein